MRTTLDLPDELLKMAKIRAVEQGKTLRQIIANALQRELFSTDDNSTARLTKAPIKLAKDAPLRSMTDIDLKTLEVEDEKGKINALSS